LTRVQASMNGGLHTECLADFSREYGLGLVVKAQSVTREGRCVAALAHVQTGIVTRGYSVSLPLPWTSRPIRAWMRVPGHGEASHPHSPVP